MILINCSKDLLYTKNLIWNEYSVMLRKLEIIYVTNFYLILFSRESKSCSMEEKKQNWLPCDVISFVPVQYFTDV